MPSSPALLPPLGDQAARVVLRQVYAPGDQDVWVTGEIESGLSFFHDVVDDVRRRTPILLHWDGARWTREVVPHAEDLSGGVLAPDGSGGLWVETVSGSTSPPHHRSATGIWSFDTMNAGRGNPVVYGMTLIPGTAQTWAIGQYLARGDYAVHSS